MKTEKKQGSRKAPRRHNPKWKDNTRAERIQKRRQRLNEIAKAHGFESWSAFETAVLNGVASLTQHALDGGESAPFQAESTPEVLSKSQALPKPTRRK